MRRREATGLPLASPVHGTLSDSETDETLLAISNFWSL